VLSAGGCSLLLDALQSLTQGVDDQGRVMLIHLLE